jgi:hypothetical protein
MLVALAVVFAVLGWLATALVDKLYGRLLQVPMAAGVALALVALALLAWGLLAKPRLQRASGKAPMDPIVAARTAALALAASRTGAVVLGFYLGVAIALVPSLSTPAGREYAAAAVGAAVASLLLTVVGLWVESICRLPDDPDSDGPGATGRPGATGGRGRRPARPASGEAASWAAGGDDRRPGPVGHQHRPAAEPLQGQRRLAA